MAGRKKLRILNQRKSGSKYFHVWMNKLCHKYTQIYDYFNNSQIIYCELSAIYIRHSHEFAWSAAITLFIANFIS